MADIFEGAIGWNNPGDLTAFPYAPDTDGIYYPRQFIPVSGFARNDGKPCIDLRFPAVMRELAAEQTLAVLGLESLDNQARAVTVRLPSDVKMQTWAVYNGIAQRVIPGKTLNHDYCWYERPIITICRLELVT